MATVKDECYDPSINQDSDSDTELNNNLLKSSPCSSPPPPYDSLDDVIQYNDLNTGRCRGPLSDSADNPGSRQCQNRKCRRIVPPGHHMYGGHAFSCSTQGKLPDDYDQTHRFCKNCARMPTCPACGGFKLDANHGRSPNKLKD